MLIRMCSSCVRRTFIRRENVHLSVCICIRITLKDVGTNVSNLVTMKIDVSRSKILTGAVHL